MKINFKNKDNTLDKIKNDFLNKNFKNNQNYVLSKNEKINLFYFVFGVKYENGLSNFMIFLFIILLFILNGITSYRISGNFVSNSFFIGIFIISLLLIFSFISFKRILYHILSKKFSVYKNTGDTYNDIFTKYASYIHKTKKKRNFYSNPIIKKINNFNLFVKDILIISKN